MDAPENCFSPTDLIEYAEIILKESIRGDTTNYSWLKSRNHPEVLKYRTELNKLRPIIEKMTAESCTKVAVKLDRMTDGVCSTAAILSIFKKILLEQHSIQLLEYKLKNAKDKKNNRHNRVHPELTPEGRLPTVSFII